jgi:hypothetical protein
MDHHSDFEVSNLSVAEVVVHVKSRCSDGDWEGKNGLQCLWMGSVLAAPQLRWVGLTGMGC